MNESTKESLTFLIDYWRSVDSPVAEEAIAEISVALSTPDPLGSDEHWQDYFDRLEGPEGCNFTKDAQDEIHWSCKGGMDKTFSRRILVDMGLDNLQVDAVHGIVNALGGHCDCEILFNAAEKILPSYGAASVA